MSLFFFKVSVEVLIVLSETEISKTVLLSEEKHLQNNGCGGRKENVKDNLLRMHNNISKGQIRN